MAEQFDAAKIKLEDGRVAYDCVKLAQIETEGAWVSGKNRNIPENCDILVRTQNTLYDLRIRGNEISGLAYRNDGHKNYLVVRRLINVHGSTWGGSMLKMNYIGIGMHLEFSIPGQKTVTTSEIQSLTIKPVA